MTLQIIQIVLLLGIFFTLFRGEFLMNWKKAYFKKKLKGVQAMILDLEFKAYKSREIREDIRVHYDDLKAQIGNLDQQIAQQKEKPTMSEDEIKRLDDNKVLMTRDLERYLGQMKQIDADLNGSKPCPEYPDGLQGVAQELEALQELKIMIKDYFRFL